MHSKRTMQPGRIPRICEICDSPFAVNPNVLAKGGRSGCYCSRTCRYASQRDRRVSLADRFWLKVVKTPCCWLWTGYRKTADGYGSIGSGGKNGQVIKAHRVSWEIHNGAIPDGLHVLHNCPGGDMPACVNPNHLWLGDHDANMKDMWRKLRAGLIHRCCHDVA